MSDLPVQSDLSEKAIILRRGAGHKSEGEEHAEEDRKIKAAPILPPIRRLEIDRQALWRKGKLRILHRHRAAIQRLPHIRGDIPDDDRTGQAVALIHLHADRVAVQPMQPGTVDFRKHKSPSLYQNQAPAGDFRDIFQTAENPLYRKTKKRKPPPGKTQNNALHYPMLKYGKYMGNIWEIYGKLTDDKK
ncbi:hypothetical protein GCWU000341_01324 [Oribacterium sp. oral taxon 078 str. F0262]|nr:hypothetical protein GCWU000341_01324 [Oribacterium sp. oral taxon 078 str. F0262]